MKKENFYSVIMAGGRGSRFWPRSRKKSSKQILNIIGKNTMIQDTVYRTDGLITPDRIYIVTNQLLRDEIIEQVPEVPEDQVIAEPKARSTAPALGLAAAMIYKKDPDAIIAAFAADHLIEDDDLLQQDLTFAAQIAEERDLLVTFGVPMLRPETGFGYILAGETITESDGTRARKVVHFTEKPNRETAESFLSNPDYFINSGMFVWKARVLLEEIDIHLPDLGKGLKKIASRLGTPLEAKMIGEIFPAFKSISIDYGVMEKSERVAMVPARFGWNDIGSWSSLYEVWPKDENGNASIGRKLSIDTKNSLIYSPKKFVATIGLEDIVIVETEDALLVCHKDRAQDVSKIVDLCRERKLEEFL